MQTDYPYIMKTQHGISLKLILVFSLLFLLSSCAKDEENMPDTPDGNGLCTATLRLNVGTFGQNGRTGTRSVGGNEDENRINNIWVFQYDAKTGASLHVPVYLDNFDSNDIDVTLTLNEVGAQSLVCIVANVGEFVDDGENADTGDNTGAGGNVGTAKEKWALDGNGNIKADFDTYEKLRQQAIPEAVSRPFISSNMGGTGGKVIPMFGVSKAMAIVSKCYVSVPLVRMFARVEVAVDPSYIHELGMEIENITFHNVPSYCRVETLASDEDYHNTSAAAYPDAITWDKFDASDANDVILYIPENLQGIVMGMTGKQETDNAKIPEHALRIELAMSYDNGSKTHTYKVYPGFDMEHDFNIMRNHIFNVSIKITKLPE